MVRLLLHGLLATAARRLVAQRSRLSAMFAASSRQASAEVLVASVSHSTDSGSIPRHIRLGATGSLFTPAEPLLTECLDEQGEEGVAHQELVQSRPALSNHGQHQDDAGPRRLHDPAVDGIRCRAGP